MICSNCGAKLQEGMRFCPNCRAELVMQYQQQGGGSNAEYTCSGEGH